MHFNGEVVDMHSYYFRCRKNHEYLAAVTCFNDLETRLEERKQARNKLVKLTKRIVKNLRYSTRSTNLDGGEERLEQSNDNYHSLASWIT